MGFTERGKVQVDYKATGLDTLSKASNIITGINQGIELLQKGLGLATKATKTFVDTGSQFERYNVQFKTLLGTMDAAQNRMEELFTFATKTPFDLPEVVEAAQKLEAYGIYSERALRDVGDAAAAMGKTLEQGVEAIADSSRGELERLKEFGISAAELTAKMGHEINRGTVEGLKELQETVLGIFAERYGGGMEALSATLGGMISNLRGRWIEFKKEVADAGAFQAVKDIVSAIMKSVDRLFDSGQGQRLAQVVGETIANALLTATKAMVATALAVYAIAKEVKVWAAKYIATPAKAVGGAVGPVLGYVPGEGTFMRKLMQLVSDPIGFFGHYGAQLGSQRGAGAERIPELDDEFQRFARALLAELEGITVGGGPGLGLAGERAGAAAKPYGMRYPAGGAAEVGVGIGVEAEEVRLLWKEGWQDDAVEVVSLWDEAHAAMARGWDDYYGHITKLAQKWGSLEKASIRDVTRAMKEGGQIALASWIDLQGQKAGLRAMEEAAEAIAAYASGNIPGGIGHTAAAVGFVALGTAAGIASGLVMAGVGSGYEAGGEYAGDSGGADSTKSRTVSRVTGITTQNLTINMNIYHQGPTFYGDGGEREFWYDHLLPLAQESLEHGTLGA